MANPEATPAPSASPCDLNEDGFVSTIDVLLFSLTFGEKVSEALPEEKHQIAKCDFNNDGRVDETDLFRIISEWKPLVQTDKVASPSLLKETTPEQSW